ncbi:M15 family metallopeptidase [bacterium]|nr:M15 family metallopeptidase [bacterium]
MKKIFLVGLILFSFIQTSIASQISYDKSDFQPVYTVIDDAVYDMRYYSSYNFTGKKIKGYKAPVAYMTKEALKALSVAAADLRKQGYRLLIWDTYRPQKAVNNFVEWIHNPNDEGNKTFYPNLKKSYLLQGGYIASKSGHSRGSTIDLTIIKQDGSFVDMGGTFDLFSEISHPNYAKLTAEQKKNRQILRSAMLNAGFKGISTEWWHYTLKNEPFPDTYFDFDVE